VGYATAWIAPNPISAFLISQGNVCRWTIVMHHISHRGLDRVPGVPERYTSRRFAKGARRFVDWLDWMAPDAWHEEHDVMHHGHTGEREDPDLVEDNSRFIRELDAPLFVKVALVAFYALTWKLTYYAPSTLRALSAARKRRAGHEREPRRVRAWNPLTVEGREFWRRCVLPYGLFRFALVPALFLPLGVIAGANVLLNSLLAEAFANIHSFLVIVPNHAGDDVYRFEGRCQSRAEFYLRQVTGSVSFRGGGDDLRDFLMGYLNYQIEHHLFPDLPPLQYRELQPRVKAICAAHGVPYIEDSLFARVRKLVAVMVGETSMKRAITAAPGSVSPAGCGSAARPPACPAS
jgi:fatty acid desaturase